MKDSRNTESIDASAVGQYPRFRRVRQGLLTLLLLAGLSGVATAGTAVVAPAAGAAVTAPAVTAPGNAALNWAETYALGHWYAWGGTGPSYDCSGLVMEAVGHADGIWLPHSTYAMLASPRLHRIPVAGAPRGALLFYGSGHVELNTIWYHTSFGAHDSGSRIGWIQWNTYWQPTAAYLVY